MNNVGRGIVTIFVGQAGVQVGNACWELFCLEHGIKSDGILFENHQIDDISYQTLFSSSKSGKFTPRSLMIDSEPTVIDEVRIGPYKNLFNPSLLITGKEDAANNFTRGYDTIGQQIIDFVLERIRGVCESCTNLTAFLFFRSFGGGTGSGFTTLLLEQLSEEFDKIPKLIFSIYPAPNISTTIVEPYNTLLSTHCCMDHEDCCFLVDNEALYDICARNLDIDRPTYCNLNRLQAQVISSVTAPWRFGGLPSIGFDVLQTNLVPYPRIHFPLVTYSPITTVKKAINSNFPVSYITDQCFEPTNQMVKCDPRQGAYMSCCLLYRGNVILNDINKAVDALKGKKTIRFVDWIPTNFKIGVNSQAPISVSDGDLGVTEKSVTMLCNNTIIQEAWNRLLQKFNSMYSKKAFIHHYISEGIDENLFVETREDIQTLIEDYQEVESL